MSVYLSSPLDCEVLEVRNYVLLVTVSPVHNFFLNIYVLPDTVLDAGISVNLCLAQFVTYSEH